MTWSKFFLRPPLLAITWMWLSLTPVQAQLDKLSIFDAPPPPDNIGAPQNGRGDGGGKRGCEDIKQQIPSSSEKHLTALVPVYGHPIQEQVWGLTTADHPTFWFYVPYKLSVTAKFVLRDLDGDLVGQEIPVALPETPGVIGVFLPSNAPTLGTGKPYHWYLKIYGKPQQPPFFVDGWITKNSLNPSIKSQLEKATLPQRVSLYATNGFWYEALTVSAELHRTNPQDTNWAALLHSVGLDNLVSEPIVESSQPKS